MHLQPDTLKTALDRVDDTIKYKKKKKHSIQQKLLKRPKRNIKTFKIGCMYCVLKNAHKWILLQNVLIIKSHLQISTLFNYLLILGFSF